MNIDELIARKLTDHQVALFRYSASIQKNVNKLLKQMGLDVRDIVLTSNPKNQREIDKLLTEIRKIIKARYTEVAEVTKAGLTGLPETEVKAVSKIINGAAGVQIFKTPNIDLLIALASGDYIKGTPTALFWEQQELSLYLKFNQTIASGFLGETAKTNRQIAKEVMEYMPMTMGQSSNLVRTAVMSVTGRARESLYSRNKDILNGVTHISTLDLRTTLECFSRDKLSWDMDHQPIDHDIPYKETPLHWGCRSVLIPWLKSWEELGILGMKIPDSKRASMDGQVSGSMSTREWITGKSETDQDKLLGKGRAKMWRDGKITLTDLLDQSGRPLTLTELQDLYN